MRAIAVVGTKKSGKTTTIENLIRELTRKGYNVAAIKHIPEPDFTIDTPGKDTWRYAKAGAKTIISVAADEIATIEKGSTVTLAALLKRCKNSDVVFIEGFKKLVALKRNIPKIVVVKSPEEAANALDSFMPIIAFSGPYNTENLKFEVPYADGQKNPKKLAEIIERVILKKKNFLSQAAGNP
ncbi:MAG: molybdopterin-guanine dinucleotide biosynthesis protein B [Candidatus Bathyarchaeota archaeon]|nr:molybdopterin-guanine dinucleotide biosynthesis protein B [Candidatus Bathyarchaeota archaeon]